LAVAIELGHPFAAVAASLKDFHGAKRRFQIMGHIGNSVVVDDYAHHPTEIQATLKAARDLDFARLLVIFNRTVIPVPIFSPTSLPFHFPRPIWSLSPIFIPREKNPLRA
jgi:hypothetical protein